MRAQKDDKEPVTGKKKPADDVKAASNDKKYPRVYITPEGTANLSCPKCNKDKTLDVSKFKNTQTSVRLRYKCQCGHSYPFILERRG